MKTLLLVKRIFNDMDEVTGSTPELQIADVPDGTDIRELKQLLEQTGHDYAWGLHTLVAREDWLEFGMVVGEAKSAGKVDYNELIAKLNAEKRITLRLPTGLHYALTQKAKNMPLNSYCIKTLADAVGYGDKLEDFEKKRNKPGRPKKLQDSK